MRLGKREKGRVGEEENERTYNIDNQITIFTANLAKTNFKGIKLPNWFQSFRPFGILKSHDQ